MCYVKDPSSSGCTDLKSSTTDPKEKWSYEACTLMKPAGKVTETILHGISCRNILILLHKLHSKTKNFFSLIKVRNAKIYPLDAPPINTDAAFPHLFEGDAKKPVNNVLTYPRWVSTWCSTAK